MSNAMYTCEPTHEFKWTATKKEIEELVVFERLHLYNRMLSCGPKALRQRLGKHGVKNIPSTRTIARVLSKNYLTHGRTGYYPEDYREWQ
jgi:hypothetical protein